MDPASRMSTYTPTTMRKFSLRGVKYRVSYLLCPSKKEDKLKKKASNNHISICAGNYTIYAMWDTLL